MSTIDALAQPAAQPEAKPAGQQAGAWGNSAPLGLAAFAVTTFMLSMINAELMKAPITPVVFGVALMFGGLAQLIAGIIQFRIGNAFTGVLFSTFGAFWLSLYAIAEFFLKDIVGPTPLATAALQGQAIGLFLFAFGAFTVWILIAALRTNIFVVAAMDRMADRPLRQRAADPEDPRQPRVPAARPGPRHLRVRVAPAIAGAMRTCRPPHLTFVQA